MVVRYSYILTFDRTQPYTNIINTPHSQRVMHNSDINILFIVFFLFFQFLQNISFSA